MNVVDLATDICRELGLDPNLVAKLELTRRAATATVYKLNEDGAKYLGEDGEPATETLTIDLDRAQ